MGAWPGPPLLPAGPGLLRGALEALGAKQPEGAGARPLNLPLGIVSMLGNCVSYASYSLMQARGFPPPEENGRKGGTRGRRL